MQQSKLTLEVRRLNAAASVIDIEGDVTGLADAALSDAYSRATANNPRNVLLNFEKLDFMNSSGIGVLVSLLVRAQRQKQRLIAIGLNTHYRNIFELTRLSDAIVLFDSEAEALVA